MSETNIQVIGDTGVKYWVAIEFKTSLLTEVLEAAKSVTFENAWDCNLFKVLEVGII